MIRETSPRGLSLSHRSKQKPARLPTVVEDVANWVLSPISARPTVTKGTKKLSIFVLKEFFYAIIAGKI